jgi:hypothetical protein
LVQCDGHAEQALAFQVIGVGDFRSGLSDQACRLRNSECVQKTDGVEVVIIGSIHQPDAIQLPPLSTDLQDCGRARKIVQHVNNVLHDMKTNVTLKLDADLLREARVVAAEEGRSISALLTDRLEAIVRERKAFDKARRRALARLREGLDLQWTPPKSRDELHER